MIAAPARKALFDALQQNRKDNPGCRDNDHAGEHRVGLKFRSGIDNEAADADAADEQLADHHANQRMRNTLAQPSDNEWNRRRHNDREE